MTKAKNIRIVGTMLVALIWLTVVVIAWVSPAKDISTAERRPLAQMPELSWESIWKGEFVQKFEDYTLDQFPMRDSVRQIKSIFHYYVLQQKDNNDIYIANGHAVKMEYPLNQSSLDNANARFEKIYNKYLKNSNTKNYISVIPDKGYYAHNIGDHLALDYSALFENIKAENEWAAYVDIKHTLNLNSFYYTDTHWRQEKINTTAWTLYFAMNPDASIDDYDGDGYIKEVDKPFYGVYYGQAALPLESEVMCYLTNDIINGCTVFDYETNKEIAIYDETAVDSKDLYDYYLSGAKALLKITNPNTTGDKELIIFRDSFGSSIAPLLIQDYKSVTLVDIRYINSDMLGNFIDFDDQDVLFLYSTSVLNNSYTLK